MKQKYVDEKVGIWFVFGQYYGGCVDVADGQRDVFEHIPKEAAEAIVEIQKEFREKLYKILCNFGDL